MHISGPLHPAAAPTTSPAGPASRAGPARTTTPPPHGPTFAAHLQHPSSHADPATATSAAAAPGPLRESAQSPVLQHVGHVLADLRADEQRLDRFVRRAAWGGSMNLPEVLAMQSLVYRYSQRVELLSKLVERLTGAVRQTLTTQI